jgi:hypothetical protein
LTSVSLIGFSRLIHRLVIYFQIDRVKSSLKRRAIVHVRTVRFAYLGQPNTHVADILQVHCERGQLVLLFKRQQHSFGRLRINTTFQATLGLNLSYLLVDLVLGTNLILLQIAMDDLFARHGSIRHQRLNRLGCLIVLLDKYQFGLFNQRWVIATKKEIK